MLEFFANPEAMATAGVLIGIAALSTGILVRIVGVLRGWRTEQIRVAIAMVMVGSLVLLGILFVGITVAIYQSDANTYWDTTRGKALAAAVGLSCAALVEVVVWSGTLRIYWKDWAEARHRKPNPNK